MMFDPQQQNVGGNSTSGHHEGKTSTRGRKKKNAAGAGGVGGGAGAGSSTTANSKMYRAHQQQQFHHLSNPRQYQSQYGNSRGNFGPSGPMPPPSMMQPTRQSTGMGFGLPAEDENTDFILDDMDRLTSRDIAMARYRRNHELLSLVFDARRIDSLELPESPYAQIDQNALKERLQEIKEESEKLRSDHDTRMKRLKEEFAIQDARLHCVPKRARLDDNESFKVISESMGEEEEEEEEVVEMEEWAKDPSKGRILGLGYIRTNTPEEVRALLPKAPQAQVAAAVATPQPATTATETPSAKEEVTGAAPLDSNDQSLSNKIAATPQDTSNAAVAVADADSSMNLVGDETAMTGISMEGEGTQQEAEVEDEEDAEEDEEDGDEGEEDGGEDDEGGQDGEGDGEHDDDADGDADGVVDGDADADEDDVHEAQEQQLEPMDAQGIMENSGTMEPADFEAIAAAEVVSEGENRAGESIPMDSAMSESITLEEPPADALDTMMQDSAPNIESAPEYSSEIAIAGDIPIANEAPVDATLTQSEGVESIEEPASAEEANSGLAVESSVVPPAETEEMPIVSTMATKEVPEQQHEQQPEA